MHTSQHTHINIDKLNIIIEKHVYMFVFLVLIYHIYIHTYSNEHLLLYNCDNHILVYALLAFQMYNILVII